MPETEKFRHFFYILSKKDRNYLVKGSIIKLGYAIILKKQFYEIIISK